ncbi:type VI secretion system-associated protein TagO [Paracoccus siganidrum]|uniref:Type VI secretion system-associated protein TagO n=1 Tax=Paracoccus siganidrum TaxID=1276757 RepID=A0A419A3X0_9RHOB|nr:hypothetical protein D3P05_16205 [Paracoccus siganidrum]RMC39434.1 hypothetical protein C9E82_04915 [Paracoccus siganidrum]
MRLVLSALILSASASQAGANVSECASVSSDLDRLACYDRVSGREPSVKSADLVGKWHVSIRESEFRDTTDVFLSIVSDESVQCGSLRDSVPAQLIIRCMENTTAMFIKTDCHLASSRYNDYGDVDVRLDDSPTTTVSMEESTDHKSLGLWSGGRSIPFVKTMIGKDTMLTRFTPYSHSPVTARFQISGLDEAITPLRESCGW